MGLMDPSVRLQKFRWKPARISGAVGRPKMASSANLSSRLTLPNSVWYRSCCIIKRKSLAVTFGSSSWLLSAEFQ